MAVTISRQNVFFAFSPHLKAIAQIEQGLEKGRKTIYPGEAKFLEIWLTLAPRLWWKTVLQFEKQR